MTDELELKNFANEDHLENSTKLLLTFFREDGDEDVLEKAATAIGKFAQHVKITCPFPQTKLIVTCHCYYHDQILICTSQ